MQVATPMLQVNGHVQTEGEALVVQSHSICWIQRILAEIQVQRPQRTGVSVAKERIQRLRFGTRQHIARQAQRQHLQRLALPKAGAEGSDPCRSEVVGLQLEMNHMQIGAASQRLCYSVGAVRTEIIVSCRNGERDGDVQAKTRGAGRRHNRTPALPPHRMQFQLCHL